MKPLVDLLCHERTRRGILVEGDVHQVHFLDQVAQHRSYCW